MKRFLILSIILSCTLLLQTTVIQASQSESALIDDTPRTSQNDSVIVQKSTPVTITEWKVPWENTRPRDPFVGPGGNVWFVGQVGNYLARFNPENGDFKKFEIPDNTGPHNLIVDKQGTVWFAGNLDAYIGKLDPEDGSIKRIPMPDEEARDPHTLRFGRENDIWFTVQGGNFIGRLHKESEKVELVKVPTSHARPYGIVIDGNNRPWICLLGTNKIATVDPDAMKIEEIELSRNKARPRRITRTPDGMIWFVDYSQGYLVRLNPDDRSMNEWPLPDGHSSYPYGMTSDHKGRIWMVETGPSPNIFIGFNPESEEFLAKTPIGSGGGTIRNMVFHEESKTIWFGTDTNYLGRAKVDF